MPRPLRIEYAGAWYHVMNRGANHQNIFATTHHKELFLSLLEDISQKFYLEIHSYCLMDNHYHLLIKTPLANLGKAMRHLDGVYTLKFNRSENRDGSLFRGRYKAILIEEESYLLQVSRYIHLNPVSARLCNTPFDFEWSSCNDYFVKNKKHRWLHTEYICKMISEKNSRQKYAAFIHAGLDEETKNFYNKQHLLTIFGKKEFVTKSLSQLKQADETPFLPDINRLKKLPNFETILSAIENHFGMHFNEIKKGIHGVKNIPKMITIYLLRQAAQMTHAKIAILFDIKPGGVCSALSRFEKIIKKDVSIKSTVEEILNHVCLLDVDT